MVCALVTGGAGFIASNFINLLAERHPDYTIVNLDKLDYCSNVYNVHRGISTFVKGDIKNRDLVTFLIKEFNFDIVFHFAAQSHVDNSFNDPVMFTYENVCGTHNLLEAFRLEKPSVKFIHFSTDEVYGTWVSGPAFRESDMLTPTNPYSSSKAAAEMIVQSYIRSFKMDIKIIRCNNVYGPNQYPEKLIPKFIKLLKSDKKCTLHGDNTPLVKRAFIHVEDVVDAVMTVHELGTPGEIYNISSAYEFSVFDITKMVIRAVKKTDDFQEWMTFIPDRPFNDERYFIDSSKLRALGWRQKKDAKFLKRFIEDLAQTI
jgi:dTDP-glucose 4,6-dehydratase/UDP-glucose 4,6-dehydratase